MSPEGPKVPVVPAPVVLPDAARADFTQSVDAMQWAEAFVAAVAAKPEIATDVATMLGWFANAIMRGFDERARRGPDELSGSEAVLMFGSWLSTRQERVVASASDPAGPIAQLVDEFCRRYHLTPLRAGWEDRAVPAVKLAVDMPICPQVARADEQVLHRVSQVFVPMRWKCACGYTWESVR